MSQEGKIILEGAGFRISQIGDIVSVYLWDSDTGETRECRVKGSWPACADMLDMMKHSFQSGGFTYRWNAFAEAIGRPSSIIKEYSEHDVGVARFEMMSWGESNG